MRQPRRVFRVRQRFVLPSTAATAAVLAAAVLAAATDAPAAPAAGAAMEDHVFIVTQHHEAGGNTARMGIAAPWPSAGGLERVGRDAIVRHFFGRHYVVNRDTGTIQVLDAATFDTLLEFSVGAGSNPQDILVVDGRTAYVSRHNSCFLYRVDPVTGIGADATDLCLFADPDGLPEMSMMARDGRHLFVQIQRLDRNDGFRPVPPSWLAVVDTATGRLIDADPARAGVQGIELVGLFPGSKMEVEAGRRRLYVSTPGVTLDGAGGIEEIALDVLVSLGFETSEAIIGPDISVFAMASPDKGYLLSHTDLTLSSHLTAFSRADGSHLAELIVVFDMVRDIAVDRATSQIFFPDFSGQGIRVFDTTSDVMLTPAPIPTGAPPVDLVIARAVTPGEATDLRVEAFDRTAGALTLSYRPACGAPVHQIVYGPLQEVSGYRYGGKVCGIGGTGLHAGFNPGEGSYFFVVAGHDGGAIEGSYGTDAQGRERPPFSGDPVCPRTQDLGRRCD
jgi:hypothetical protein